MSEFTPDESKSTNDTAQMPKVRCPDCPVSGPEKDRICGTSCPMGSQKQA